jgi:glyoxylate/hydroxypyruvate reductase
MDTVAFYQKDSTIALQNNWENRLKLFLPKIKLVPLLSNEAKYATSALLWKAPLERLRELHKIKGLISLGQGVDHILNKTSLPHNIPVVRIVDPYMAKSMSHWVLLSVLNFFRDTFNYYNKEKSKIYEAGKHIDFLSVKIGLYGIGAIGKVVAEDLHTMGFNVNGWSRTQKQIDGINCYSGKEGFSFINKTSDIHICILPLTETTHSIFDNNVFADMKKGSCFINAGRGEHVVEEDLLQNCKSNHISTAVLDVYRNEPLPVEHPFWEQENIRIWPHVASETNPETAAKQIANAISCINNNITPPNTVDRSLGY